MKIVKRDGHMVDYCPEKIEKAKADKNETPVIIRREVIINDETQVPKEHVKKEEKRNNL